MPLGCVSSIPRNGLTEPNMDDAKHGDFIDFLGTHYAIFDNKVVDLRTLEEESIPFVCVPVARWWLLPRRMVA